MCPVSKEFKYINHLILSKSLWGRHCCLKLLYKWENCQWQHPKAWLCYVTILKAQNNTVRASSASVAPEATLSSKWYFCETQQHCSWLARSPEPPPRVPFPALRFKALVCCKSLTLTLTSACDKGRLQRGSKGKERQQLESLKSQLTG